MSGNGTVFVVDSDVATREAVFRSTTTMGLSCETYDSGEQFLETFVARPGCVVLEVRMPGKSGMQVQQCLAANHTQLPVIYLTAYGSVSIAVRAMRAGAVDFLEKPIVEQHLSNAIAEAIALYKERAATQLRRAELHERVARLTHQERQVLEMVVEGQLNKVIASKLGLSVRTIELRRASLRNKLRVRSLASLIRLTLADREGTRPRHMALSPS